MANNAITCSLINFSSKHHQLISPSLPKPRFHGHGRYNGYGLSIVCPRRHSFSLISSSKLYHFPIIRVDSSVKREQMLPPYNVLITGSTKGIGYALAKEFLKAGDNVLICSRSAERVESAVHSLREEFGEQHVWGTKCDVREGKEVADLVAFAQKNLKYVDIWI